MKFKMLLVLTVVIGLASCKPQSKDIQNISVIELKNRIDNGKVQLLDVRTPKEWNQGTINGALKVNVTANGFETKADEVLDKSKEVYVYCRSGGRSLVASKLLKEKGYKVYNVEGGYIAWKDKIEK